MTGASEILSDNEIRKRLGRVNLTALAASMATHQGKISPAELKNLLRQAGIPEHQAPPNIANLVESFARSSVPPAMQEKFQSVAAKLEQSVETKADLMNRDKLGRDLAHHSNDRQVPAQNSPGVEIDPNKRSLT